MTTRKSPSPEFVLAATGVVLVFLLFVDRTEYCSPVYNDFCSRVLDVAHAPLFFAVTVALYVALRRKFACALYAVIIAAVVEVIQPYVGRSESFSDWVNSSIGACFAVWFLSALEQKKFGAKNAVPFFALGLVATCYMFLPAFAEWRALEELYTHFPRILDFSSKDQLRLVAPSTARNFADTKIERVQSDRARGGAVLEVYTGRGYASGIKVNSADMDWRAYKQLVIEIENPGEPFDLHLRIDDTGDVTEFDSRINRKLELKTGYNRIVLPLADMQRTPSGRVFGLERVRNLRLFAYRDDRPRRFSLDAIYLE